MAHFTYSESTEKKRLKQGDILSKSPDLCSVLKDVHPHYLKEDYTHFMVLTQSCDLVPRTGNLPSARYITLAAVRPLELALERELEKRGAALLIEGEVYRNAKTKEFAEAFLDKLFNNNITDYFFLKSDPDVGLKDDSCCFLHLSIALKTELHFDTCLNSKVAELNGVFQSKLGWLVGNLYSRVGTPDWTPDNFTKEEFKKLLKDTVEGTSGWIPQDLFPLFQRLEKEMNGSTFDEIFEKAKSKKLESVSQKITQIASLIGEKCKLTSDQINLLQQALKEDKSIQKYINTK